MTAERFVPIFHRMHNHIGALDAEFPIGTDDPSGEEIGELFVGDKTIHSIRTADERTIHFGKIAPEGLFVVACAVLDFKEQKIYTFNGAREHSRLKQVFSNLVDSDEQSWANEGQIYGFVTASGHFLNREMTHYVLKKYHPSFLNKKADDTWFNSDMIDWKAVDKMLQNCTPK